MGRAAKPDELVGVTEVAEMVGVTVAAVSNWRHRHSDYPEPWGQFKMGPLWLREDIEKYLAHREAVAKVRIENRIEELRAELAELESRS